MKKKKLLTKLVFFVRGKSVQNKIFKANCLNPGVGGTEGADLSTRGPGWTYHWWTGCSASCSAG